MHRKFHPWPISFLFFGTAVLVLTPAPAVQSQTANSAFVCPVTQAPQPPFTPTGVSPQSGNGSFHFGTKKLSVLLVHPWYQHQTKIPWFSDDAQFPNPVNLTATGHRLDGPSPVPEFGGANIARSTDRNGGSTISFITSSMKFPEAGCWEITARMNDSVLRFVTNVLPGAPR